MLSLKWPISDVLPSFTNALKNISVPIERDVTFTCNVKNIGHYRVGPHTSNNHKMDSL